MIKKYIGITLITASMLAMGCSSSDDDDSGSTTGDTAGTTTGDTAGTTTGDTAGTTTGDTAGTTTGDTAGTTTGDTAGTTTGDTAGTTTGDTAGGDGNTIVDALTADGNYSTLLAAVTAADLGGTLANETDTFTLFAPTDAAFTANGQTLDQLTADLPALTNVLQFHIVGGQAVAADALTDGAVLTMSTPDSQTNTIAVSGDEVQIGSAVTAVVNVAGAITASNGIIYPIDMVLSPAPPSSDPTDPETTDPEEPTDPETTDPEEPTDPETTDPEPTDP